MAGNNKAKSTEAGTAATTPAIQPRTVEVLQNVEVVVKGPNRQYRAGQVIEKCTDPMLLAAAKQGQLARFIDGASAGTENTGGTE